ncbi:hypothetical protein NQ314_015402 [Rhamnusium bicolor]|uniref:Uncharacterized protein n=1 Tax=Rhamnusium bicolor TaxID=1586634 RepID=A0AAV8WZI7_9CUCU|nr:hypothetical protein NQ314_015402 [Rhamnusium bicolor]
MVKEELENRLQRNLINLFQTYYSQNLGYTLGLFKKGFQKDLEEEDLYEVIEKCRSKKCGDRTERQWNKSRSIYKLLWKRFGVQYSILCLFNIAFRQIYRKALKLSPASFSETNLGNIVTILTKDIHTVEENLWLLMDLVVYILQTLTISYLLFAKMGDACFIGLGLMFVALPIQTYLSSMLKKMRLKVGENADQRLQVTQETLSAIKIIKMYTWEKFFDQKISDTRKKEMTTMMKAFYINFIIIGIGILTSKITFLVLILSYIWMGYTTSTELIFYILGLFHQLTWSLGILIPINLSKIAEFRAAFIRYNKLMQSEETTKIEENVNGKSSLELTDLTVNIKDKEILKNVSLKINHTGLTLITGVVGSGKSSLLKAILREYLISKGDIEIQGTVSYASQDPWLFPSSIKQNILFGQKYEASRYDEVIRVCALKHDLSLLENGDETIVADRGMNLSKGQQSRINLARAVYKNSDIYLLDDSLTALDGKVQDFIFEECVKRFLNDKICILVTQNAGHLEKADHVVIMNQGTIFLSGEPRDIWNKKINGVTQIHENENKTSNIQNLLEKRDKEGFLLEAEQQYFKKKVYHEIKKVGKVELTVYKKYFQFGGGLLIFSVIISTYVLSQIFQSASDKLITHWIDLQQKVLDLQANSSINETYYKETVTKKDDTFTVYTILVIVKVIIMLLKWYALLRFCRNASINIHKMMSSRIVHAVMSFFDTHFIGNILNRFSHDMNNIDENLPHLLPSLIRIVLNCVGGIILISTVNWTFLIPSCVLLIILMLLRMVYMPTGRSLKRLEAANLSAGNVGLALTQVIMLTNHVQYAIKQWTQLENYMTSVERSLEYTNVKQEEQSGGEMNHWPSEGGIKYEKVTLRYENAKDPVLKSICFSVKPKQKIGIVGRTGAGKSSIISTLRSIAIIPQDPILFTGTIRDNLDPNRKYTDGKIWKAIEQVKIKDLVPSLDLEVKESGASFSAGQKQLICLARAALGKYKIVVLDEATANMDSVTDKMLHGIIEDIFVDCTILTIAHRLHSILNCDLVMVLDNGELIEFDNPKKLLQNKSTHFYKMCRETEMGQ